MAANSVRCRGGADNGPEYEVYPHIPWGGGAFMCK